MPQRSRIVFENPDALLDYRCEVIENIGPEYGFGVMYGTGFTEGMSDALPVARGFSGAMPDQPHIVGAPINMVFRPDQGNIETSFQGVLQPSIEAFLHLRSFRHSPEPACHVSAGYSAGWYSALIGETILVREIACVACGDEVCRFEARRLTDWIEIDEEWAHMMVPHIDLDAIRGRASELVMPTEGPDQPVPAFDPTSPAIHVWGPVMVLPYGGAEDSVAALDVVMADIDADEVEVVVIDATGTKIDTTEALGMTRLLDALEANGIEAILVGHVDAEALNPAQRNLALPLTARDVPEAIALAFQLCELGTQVA